MEWGLCLCRCSVEGKCCVYVCGVVCAHFQHLLQLPSPPMLLPGVGSISHCHTLMKMMPLSMLACREQAILNRQEDGDPFLVEQVLTAISVLFPLCTPAVEVAVAGHCEPRYVNGLRTRRSQELHSRPWRNTRVSWEAGCPGTAVKPPPSIRIRLEPFNPDNLLTWITC